MKQIILTLWILCLSACSMLGPEKVRHNKTTSLVNFLYPDGNIPKDLPSPTLHLPLRVGLAFIPEANGHNTINNSTKNKLLNGVKQQFSGLRYIKSIEIIPSIYLSNRSHTSQLEQIRQLYQLDVIALVSYDQIVNRKENLLAMTYLTIVGNYIFPGSHFDVNTLIDMALIDLDSKRLLFRAAGTNASKGVVAEAFARQHYDKHQNRDFTNAMTMMQQNLATELSAFEQRLRSKDPNDDIKVVAKKGYEMSFGLDLLLFLIMLAFIKLFLPNKDFYEC
ncbi:MAG: rhombotarget lipoprotein [Marinicella sp.]